jgi:hypothetical protein
MSQVIKGQRFARIIAISAVLAIASGAPSRAMASHLAESTLQDWNTFIDEADKQFGGQASGSAFLRSDGIPGQTDRLRRGEIIVSPASAHVPIKIRSGLIHDWIGAAFMPGATLEDVVTVIRSYARYKEFYKPSVVESKLISSEDSRDQFAILLTSKSTKTALDADFQCTNRRLSDQRWSSITTSTRVQEVAEYGTPSQHTLPENEGKGLIWRLHTIVRLEERDGGVYIEVEAIALSRDIPAGVRWLIAPMVRRVSRSSLLTSLQQTEAATRTIRESRTETRGE